MYAPSMEFVEGTGDDDDVFLAFGFKSRDVVAESDYGSSGSYSDSYEGGQLTQPGGDAKPPLKISYSDFFDIGLIGSQIELISEINIFFWWKLRFLFDN